MYSVQQLPSHNTVILIRGLSFMTSALRGEGVPSKADIVSNVSKGGSVNLRTRGELVKKIRKFADVIYGSPLK